MGSTKIIKQVDADHVVDITTTVNERLVAKVTLEAQKQELQGQIDEIDEQLLLFVE